jgi:putative hydrolase of the HAD superfamily
MEILLLDADGVVLKKYKEYFSETFIREQKVAPEGIRVFFKEKFKLCQTGKLDLKEELGPVLLAAGWDKGADAFLEYWFSEDVQIDEEVLDYVQDLRARGVQCFLTTDQEKYRKGYIQQLLDGQFDGYFISCDLGFQKSQPEFFQKALEQLGVAPGDVAYWDDDQQNVDTARSCGIDAHFYTSLEDLKNAADN